MLQNASVTAFTVSELLRQSQQDSKINPHPTQVFPRLTKGYKGIITLRLARNGMLRKLQNYKMCFV